MNEHEKDKDKAELKHKQQYKRLQRELKIYRDKMTKALNEMTDKLSEATARIHTLEGEIATGKPGERRLFELATLQARRDSELEKQRNTIEQTKQELDRLRAAASKHSKEKAFL